MSVDVGRIELQGSIEILLGYGPELSLRNMLIEPVGPAQVRFDIRWPPASCQPGIENANRLVELCRRDLCVVVTYDGEIFHPGHRCSDLPILRSYVIWITLENVSVSPNRSSVLLLGLLHGYKSQFGTLRLVLQPEPLHPLRTARQTRDEADDGGRACDPAQQHLG